MLSCKKILVTAAFVLLCTWWPGLANAAGDSGLQYGEKTELAPGIAYYPFTYLGWSGEITRGHITEITPGGELLEIIPALGSNKLGGRETVSSLATRHGAVAAINGGFFDGGSGNPIGALVVDDAIHYYADVLRTSVGWTSQGRFEFGYFTPGAVVDAGKNSFIVDVYNRIPQANEVALFTPLRNGGLDLSSYNKVPLTKTDNGIFQLEDTAGPDSYILVLGSGVPDYAKDLNVGDRVNIEFYYGPNFNSIDHLMTGGPLLVQDGVPVFQAINEGFRGSVLAPNARTAVGVKENGNILLIVVEKKTTATDTAGDGQAKEATNTDSAGLTTEELAWLMSRLGAQRAAALDGGGSSAMWSGGKLVSRPSGNSERVVANALLVLYQIPTYLDGQRVYFDVSPFVDKGRSFAPLRGIFELLGAKVDWEEETGTIKAVRGSRSVTLTIGKKEALVGDEPVVLDAVPRVVNGRTMVPVRFISESLGAGVDWQTSPKALYIYSPGGEVS